VQHFKFFLSVAISSKWQLVSLFLGPSWIVVGRFFLWILDFQHKFFFTNTCVTVQPGPKNRRFFFGKFLVIHNVRHIVRQTYPSFQANLKYPIQHLPEIQKCTLKQQYNKVLFRLCFFCWIERIWMQDARKG
jgi:hypothetical protein